MPVPPPPSSPLSLYGNPPDIPPPPTSPLEKFTPGTSAGLRAFSSDELELVCLFCRTLLEARGVQRDVSRAVVAAVTGGWKGGWQGSSPQRRFKRKPARGGR